MKNTFDPWLHPIEKEKAEVLLLVTDVALKRSVPFMVFGAFSRELHFYHQHGIVCPRRTQDIDFSIQVTSWDEYNAFRGVLTTLGFSTENPEHPEKLSHQATWQEIDLLAFGEIEEGDPKLIKWPIENSPWSVLGFDEVFENAITFKLNEEEIAVVSLPMLVALKIVAVRDREQVRHKKDGTDIAFILRTPDLGCI